MFIKVQGVYCNMYQFSSYHTTEEYKTGPDGSEVLVYCIYYQTGGGRYLKDEFTSKAEFDARILLLEGKLPKTPMLAWVYNDEAMTDLQEVIGCNTHQELKDACVNKQYVRCTGTCESGRLNFESNTSLLSLDLSGLDTSKVTSLYASFRYCTNIKSLNMKGLKTSNVESTGNMFFQCNALEFLDVSGWDTSNVKDMSYMFFQCTKLKTIDVRCFNTSSVTNFGYMFTYCSSVVDLDVSNFNTSSATDMTRMFYLCSATDIDVSSFDTSNVIDLSRMFASCLGVTKLDLSSFNTVNTKDMTRMFTYSRFLQAINMYKFVANPELIYADMFLSVTATIITNQDFATFLVNTVGYSGEIIVVSSYEESQQAMAQFKVTPAVFSLHMEGTSLDDEEMFILPDEK